MSFRLRIFVLVMLVAVTAIGATAWLTLNLTSREVAQAQAAQNRHRSEIIDAITEYGLRHGNWPGVNALVMELSERTDLHIQLQTEEGEVLVDSDVEARRNVGPVQAVAYDIDPIPVLGFEDFSDPNPKALLLYRTANLVPRSLFGPAPNDPIYGSSAVRALREAAQYRTGLVLVRCLAKALPVEPALGLTKAPYVTPEQLAKSPLCLKQATNRVLGDSTWYESNWDFYRNCTGLGRSGARPVGKDGKGDACIDGMFRDAVITSSAVPLQLYLGGRTTADVTALGRPAVFGAAGLVLVALVGTFWIARRVSRPVRRLTDASQLLAGGQLDVRVPASGGSELARLSASFNAMAEAVQRSEERQRRLVADVAHEMRTPLSNLRGYLEGLSDGVIEPSRELFVSLHEETMLQNRILDDLQVLALAEAGDLGYTRMPIDLADLAATSATAHRAVAAEAGVALTVDASTPVWVDADQDRLRQVLGNLLTNAIRYTDREGQVLIRVRAEGRWAVLIVQDTGVGIAAGDLPHVFDRFWRADPARQRATGGTGLGLTIAHRIVTDHDGRIEVASRPHVGTTFTVRLPQASPEA